MAQGIELHHEDVITAASAHDASCREIRGSSHARDIQVPGCIHSRVVGVVLILPAADVATPINTIARRVQFQGRRVSAKVWRT